MDDKLSILAEMDSLHERVRRALSAGDINKALSLAIQYGMRIELLAHQHSEEPGDTDETENIQYPEFKTGDGGPRSDG
jgi:hypothetical protein